MTLPSLFDDHGVHPDAIEAKNIIMDGYESVEDSFRRLAQYMGEPLSGVLILLGQTMDGYEGQMRLGLTQVYNLGRRLAIAEEEAAEGRRVLEEQNHQAQDLTSALAADVDQSARQVGTIKSLRKIFASAGLGEAVDALTVVLDQMGYESTEIPAVSDSSPVLQALRAAEEKAEASGGQG